MSTGMLFQILLQEMIQKSITACFQILFEFIVMLCNAICMMLHNEFKK